jgi:hypothetical protein
MSHLNKHLLRNAILISCLLSILGCNPQRSPGVPTSNNTPKPLPTESASYTPSHTYVSTITAIATSTNFSEVPTIIWNPIPTLSPQESMSKASDLLINNGGCLFPCWWGITPGKTSAVEAIQFLATFTELRTVIGTPGNERSTILEPGSSFNYMSSTYQINGNYGGTDYTFEDGMVDTISPYHGGGTGNRRAEVYELSRVLSTYQKPDEIWFAAAPGSPAGNVADIYLFYGKQGFFVHYAYFDLKRDQINMQICPQGIGPEELAMWAVQYHQYTSLENYYFHTTVSKPSFELATGMNPEDFYQMYKNIGNNQCFDTPVSLWEYEQRTATPSEILRKMDLC